MQCTSCRCHSDNLREYSRVIELDDIRKTIDTFYLCASCRIINVIDPGYISARMRNESARATPARA